MKEFERISWRCRRGMLELDIVLGRFVQQHYANLNEAQQAAFDLLLGMPDQTLWDTINNPRCSSLQSEECAVLELLKMV